jgi:hypothetical protein
VVWEWLSDGPGWLDGGSGVTRWWFGDGPVVAQVMAP